MASRSTPMIELMVLISETASAPPVARGLGGLADVGDVGGELDHHRHPGVGLAPARDHLDVFRHLAHGRAHAALGHAVRAAEIELDAVGTGLLDPGQDRLPALLGAGDHERDQERPVRPVALDLLDLLQVHLERPVGDQLDVVEADHAPVLGVDGAVARAVDVDDRRVLAQRLPDHAAPAGAEGALDIVGLVGGRGARPARTGWAP